MLHLVCCRAASKTSPRLSLISEIPRPRPFRTSICPDHRHMAFLCRPSALYYSLHLSSSRKKEEEQLEISRALKSPSKHLHAPKEAPRAKILAPRNLKISYRHPFQQPSGYKIVLRNVPPAAGQQRPFNTRRVVRKRKGHSDLWRRRCGEYGVGGLDGDRNRIRNEREKELRKKQLRT